MWLTYLHAFTIDRSSVGTLQGSIENVGLSQVKFPCEKVMVQVSPITVIVNAENAKFMLELDFIIAE